MGARGWSASALTSAPDAPRERLVAPVEAGSHLERQETVVNVGTANSSPVSNLPPIVTVPDNQIFTFQLPGFDPNGNTLTYRLATSTESLTPTMPTGLSVSSSGLLTWDVRNSTLTTAPGDLWTTQYMVEDGLTKTPVDFILKIGQPVAVNNPPTVTANPAGPFSRSPSPP